MNELTTYSVLCLTVILLWVPKVKGISLWWISLIIAVVVGLIEHRLAYSAIPIMFIFTAVVYFFGNEKLQRWLRILLGCVIVLFGYGLMTHLMPGFHNLKVIDHVLISPDAIPFTAYLNFDKTLVGIIIIGLTHHLISTRDELRNMVKQTYPYAIAIMLIIMMPSLLLSYVRFDPKIPDDLLIWSLKNLLFVCLAEEAFFRGFIQKNLSLLLKNLKFGYILSIVIASIAFGLAHYKGGMTYVMLATFAGIGYGYVYHKTSRIEASMLTHFLLNLTHILFFTYPALASAMGK